MKQPDLSFEWLHYDTSDKKWDFRVNSPRGGTFSGRLGHDQSGNPSELTTADFHVDEQRRERGIGTQLLMGAVAVAKEQGATKFVASVESPEAMHIRQKLFGENMKFSDYDPTTKTEITVPITTEQAIQSLNRATEFEYDLEFREHGFMVEVDLNSVDTSDWTLPSILNERPDPEIYS